MSAMELKASLQQYVNEANDDLLEELKRILEKHFDEPNAELRGTSTNQ